MNASHTNNAIAKISMGLDAVFATPPAERANSFVAVHRAIDVWLAALDAEGPRLGDPVEIRRGDFVRRAHIYLRALKTYPAGNEEWLEVFWAFRQLFDRWTLNASWREVPVPSRGAGELDRLRVNPHLVLRSETA